MASPEASVALPPDALDHGPRRTRPRVRKGRLAVAVAALAAVAATSAVVLVQMARDDSPPPTARPAPSARLLLAGPPAPQVVALRDDLRLYLPVAPERITAVGFRAAGPGALPLDPVGEHRNAGSFAKAVDRFFGAEATGGPGYVLIDGGTGPRTGGLDVGAPPGTDVYSPVDGVVLAISDVVRDGHTLGQRIDLQPAGNPGIVVQLSHVRALPGLEVGVTVLAAKTPLGRVVDFSDVERAALASYTQDSGQHVHLEVHAAPEPALG